jgi:hypothetical protein
VSKSDDDWFIDWDWLINRSGWLIDGWMDGLDTCWAAGLNRDAGLSTWDSWIGAIWELMAATMYAVDALIARLMIDGLDLLSELRQLVDGRQIRSDRLMGDKSIDWLIDWLAQSQSSIALRLMFDWLDWDRSIGAISFVVTFRLMVIGLTDWLIGAISFVDRIEADGDRTDRSLEWLHASRRLDTTWVMRRRQ